MPAFGTGPSLSQRAGAWVISKEYDAFYGEVVAFLQAQNVAVLGSTDGPLEADFTVVLGGDGTVLAAARQRIPSPVVVINTGHLGFLTSANKDNYRAVITSVLHKKHSTTKRNRLEVEVGSKWEGRGPVIGYRQFFALNEVVIAKNSASKLVKLAVYINDGTVKELVSEYRADGLIVSTPTGSTAYNLSAGGPIIHPSCPSFVVTPICPQGLTQRPLVLPGNVELILQPLEDDLYVTIDGQIGQDINATDHVEVRYDGHPIEFVNPYCSYYQVLRQKLAWGVKPV